MDAGVHSVWMERFLMVTGAAFLLFMGALCFLLLRKMWKDEIDLSTILNEANGDASMSRFQLLLFSLVSAVGMFLYMLNHLDLPVIPDSVLVLLGISATTYAAGKGISFSRTQGIEKPGQVPPNGPPLNPDAGPAKPADPAPVDGK